MDGVNIGIAGANIGIAGANTCQSRPLFRQWITTNDYPWMPSYSEILTYWFNYVHIYAVRVRIITYI